MAYRANQAQKAKLAPRAARESQATKAIAGFPGRREKRDRLVPPVPQEKRANVVCVGYQGLTVKLEHRELPGRKAQQGKLGRQDHKGLEERRETRGPRAIWATPARWA